MEVPPLLNDHDHPDPRGVLVLVKLINDPAQTVSVLNEALGNGAITTGSTSVSVQPYIFSTINETL